MELVNAHFQIVQIPSGQTVLDILNLAGRVCYQSHPKTNTNEEKAAFIKNKILASGHESVIEHLSATVRIVCDRGVTHEIVRHRLGAYSQESTRFCNYSKSGGVKFILPFFFDDRSDESPEQEEARVNRRAEWTRTMLEAETAYLELIRQGASPQEARSVLPNSLKTEIIVTYNLRQWRHFFKLRAMGTTGNPHPQMLEIAIPMLLEFKSRIPVVFDDIHPQDSELGRRFAGEWAAFQKAFGEGH